eukprot:jgi/Psemu1/18196/gm1.18196_g
MQKIGFAWRSGRDTAGIDGIVAGNDKPKRMAGCVDSTCSKRSIPVLFIVVLFLMETSVCGAIGNWGKKPTESAEKNDSSSSKNNNSSTHTHTHTHYNHYNNHHHQDSDANKTYLDLFGETAKDFLTRRAPERILHAFPATDSECRWDWRYFRCEPYCECSLRPKLPGDFHLGRACRVRDDPASDDDDDDNANTNANANANANAKIDAVYRNYCSGTSTATTPPPPPFSIPSPVPFLVRTSRGTWRVVRARAEPVLARAADELETMQGRVRDVVCGDLNTRCSDNGDGRSDAASIEVAWQERLVCGDVVRECGLANAHAHAHAHAHAEGDSDTDSHGDGED